MLTPEYLSHVADDAIALYEELETSIVRDIVRRLVKTGQVTDTARWQIQRVQEAGLLYDDVIRQAARLAGVSADRLRAVFLAAGLEAVNNDAHIYRAAGLDPLPLALSPAAGAVLTAGYRKTEGYLRNLTMTTASQAQWVYIQASTLAEMQIESGAMDYTTIREAVRSAAHEGARVSYPSGHRDRLDVAVRRAVMTGVNQTAAQVANQYADMMGCDLVEVTAHSGARPSHAAWQGKIYSRSGTHQSYPPLSVTGYGTGAGLCGWNCRHNYYPFFEGLSSSAYPRAALDEYNNRTVQYNGEEISYYDATQLQRQMERHIRDSKRDLAGLDEGIKRSTNDELRNALRADFSNASVRLKKQEEALKEFLRNTGLQKDSTRTQVLGFSKSQAQKAVAANKKIRSFSTVLNGIKTPAGVTVSGATTHFGERAVSRGLSVQDIQDPLTAPLRIGKIKTDSKGRKSLELTGEKARVQINPDDGSLITVWRTSEKLKRRLKGEANEV